MSDSPDIDPDATSYYARLGVKPGADSDDINRRWKEAQARYHPDAGGEADQFRQLRRAHEVLSSDKLRPEYDDFVQALGPVTATLCFEEQDARLREFDPSACENFVTEVEEPSSTKQQAATSHTGGSNTDGYRNYRGGSSSSSKQTSGRSSSSTRSKSKSRRSAKSGPSVAYWSLFVSFLVRIGVGATLAAGLLYVPGPQDQLANSAQVAFGLVVSFGGYQITQWARGLRATSPLIDTSSIVILIVGSGIGIGLLGPVSVIFPYVGLEYLINTLMFLLFLMLLFGIIGALFGSVSMGVGFGQILFVGNLLLLHPTSEFSFVSFLREQGIDPYPIVPQIDFYIRVSVLLNAALILVYYVLIVLSVLLAFHFVLRGWVKKKDGVMADYVAVPTFSDLGLTLPLVLIGFAEITSTPVPEVLPKVLENVPGSLTHLMNRIIFLLLGCLFLGILTVSVRLVKRLN